ncbi:MAG: putative membrane protein YhiD involved in acid resistance [Saprospiraceae bacterium]|jgi:uncharacterized membrane protein YhiD involved in acid resistance
MLDLSSLQYNSEYPGITAIIFTVLCSVLLGILIAFTYEKTSRDVDRPDNFLQALILVTIVAAMVIQAIGDSLARGLGMIGALSIIRFRTTIKDPRNIVFMFGSIAAGIACGVMGFTIAIFGTVGFCLTAFMLRFSSFSEKEKLFGNLKIKFYKVDGNRKALEKVLSKHCTKFAVSKKEYGTGSGKKANLIIYDYRIKLKDSYAAQELVDDLDDLYGIVVGSLIIEHKLIDSI